MGKKTQAPNPLAVYLEKAGIGQTAFAVALTTKSGEYCDRNRIHILAHGKSMPTMVEAYDVAKAMGVAPGKLMAEWAQWAISRRKAAA